MPASKDRNEKRIKMHIICFLIQSDNIYVKYMVFIYSKVRKFQHISCIIKWQYKGYIILI